MWELSLEGGPTRLAARLLEPAPFLPGLEPLFISNEDSGPAYVDAWYVDPQNPGQLPSLYNTGLLKLTPHFPYGRLVEPDR